MIEPKWFGPGSRPETEKVSIEPFRISVDDKVLVDLKARLKLDLERLSTQHPVSCKILSRESSCYVFNLLLYLNIFSLF